MVIEVTSKQVDEAWRIVERLEELAKELNKVAEEAATSMKELDKNGS